VHDNYTYIRGIVHPRPAVLAKCGVLSLGYTHTVSQTELYTHIVAHIVTHTFTIIISCSHLNTATCATLRDVYVYDASVIVRSKLWSE
jgi:hypothetical protein